MIPWFIWPSFLVVAPRLSRRALSDVGEFFELASSESISSWPWVPLMEPAPNVRPAGTRPEDAAQIIGGLPVSANFFPNIAACGAIMAADHLFDVI